MARKRVESSSSSDVASSSSRIFVSSSEQLHLYTS